MTVSVNGAETPVESGLSTWGDLVASLDGRLAGARHVMTSVRLDGVEEPAFRDPRLCASRLSSFQRIDIETGAPDVLARRSLADAAEALGDLARAAREAAGRFRTDEVAAAQQDLEQVSQGLLIVLRIVAAAGLALRRELESPDRHGLTLGALTSQLDGHLRELVDAQRSEDWLQVADVLEFDLDPMLSAWQGALAGIAAA